MGKKQQFVPQRKGVGGFDALALRLKQSYEAELAKAKADYDYRLGFAIDFLTQAGCDAFFMTANDMFDLGPARVKEAAEKYREYIVGMMDALIADSYDEKTGNGDKDLEYFWNSVDERIRQIEGESLFTPHTERYPENGITVLSDLFVRFVRRAAEKREAEKAGAGDGKA